MKRLLQRTIGRLIGTALGLLGGIVGGLFGFIIGYLVDLVLLDVWIRRQVNRFLASSTPPPERSDRLLLGTALSCIYLEGKQNDPAGTCSRCLEKLVHDLRDIGSRRYIDRFLGVVLGVAENIDALEVLGSMPPFASDDAERIFLALHSPQLTPERYSRLLRVGRALRLSDEWIGLRRPAGLLDPEACAVLGIPQTASRQELKKAFRSLASQFHPDTGAQLSQDQQTATEVAFLRVRESYETLLGQLDEWEAIVTGAAEN